MTICLFVIATTLAPASYGAVYAVLAQSDIDSIISSASTLLPQLLTGLSTYGTLHIQNASSIFSSIRPELERSGFEILTEKDDTGALIAQKATPKATTTSSSPASVPLSRPTAASVPLRRLNGDAADD